MRVDGGNISGVLPAKGLRKNGEEEREGEGNVEVAWRAGQRERLD